jgi:hypothetical protein
MQSAGLSPFGNKKELYLSIFGNCMQLARERLCLQALPQELDFFA